MIKNKKQLSQSKVQLAKLKELADKYRDAKNIVDKAKFGSLECQIEDLENEISEYETIKENGINGLSFDLSNLEKSIMSLRIASGLTQKELADKIGVAEQHIQRYEIQDYQKTSFERIIELISVLTDDINLTFVKNTDSKVIKFDAITPDIDPKLKLIQDRQALLVI